MSKRDTYVVVTVDTAQIEEEYGNLAKTTTPMEILVDKQYVTFSDNRGDASGKGNNFTSTVNKSKNIIWIGIAEIEGATVQIIDFEHKGGHKIVDNIHENYGVLEGKIKNGNSNETETEIYSLKFQINGMGNIYEIDPQLEMAP